jgi:subtilisin family serine protease
MSHETTRRSVLAGAGALLGGATLGTRHVTAQTATNRYIVDLEPAGENALDGLDVVHDIEEIDAAVVRGSDDDVSHLRATEDVRFEVSTPKEATVDEIDAVDAWAEPLYDLQWDKSAQDVPYLHWQHRGEGARVAIIDSGVYADHPDLEGAVDEELSTNLTTDDGDFNPNGAGDHGTHVAGTVAASDDNNQGVYGTAPGADIVAFRVFSATAGASFGSIIQAMVSAGTTGCDVANMSLGAYPLPRDSPLVELFKLLMERAVDYGNSQGCLYVAAAGNDGTNLDADGNVISLPNEADNVMSVAATGPIGYRWDDHNRTRDNQAALNDLWKYVDTPAFYTNYGEEAIDVSAPGGNFDLDANAEEAYFDLVLSTIFTEVNGDVVPTWGWKAGTSMAAPNVAGAAALVMAENPDATPADVREHLESTADDVWGEDEYHGEGHLDTARAVRKKIN